MHPRALAFLAIVLFALPAFAETLVTDLDLAQKQEFVEVAELQAPNALGQGFGLSLAELRLVVAPEQAMSSVQLTSSFDDGLGLNRAPRVECVQGTTCRFNKDPVCGRDGFCNLPSRCCMCY